MSIIICQKIKTLLNELIFFLHYLYIPVINVLFYSYLLMWIFEMQLHDASFGADFCNDSGEMSVECKKCPNFICNFALKLIE